MRTADTQKNLLAWFIAETIATGLGSGRWPFAAPATVGTFVGLVAYWMLSLAGIGENGDSLGFYILIGVSAVVGIWATGYIDSEEDHDPKRVVIDEWVGVWITVLFLPVTLPWLLAGFFVFRFLDILKPLGIRRFEVIPSGWGIMLDDIGAGIVGALILNVIRLVFFA